MADLGYFKAFQILRRKIKMAELLVVRSKIKSCAEGCNVSGDFAEELSKKVEVLIKDAARRAKANKRSTIKARDL